MLGDHFDIIDLESGSDPTSFSLLVRPELCTPFQFLYGGTGVAASVEASERAAGRPLQWITTQFLGSPSPGQVVDLVVDLAVAGRSTTQTSVVGSVEGVTMFTSLCAHNVRPPAESEPFTAMPDVPGYDECEPLSEIFDTGVSSSFFDALDRRVAAGKFAADAVGLPQRGPLAVWCRLRSGLTGSAATQGFVADLGPLAVCAALGIAPGGTSLDNTLRIVDDRPAEWVLIELHADGFHRSVGHSTARLWSEDGRLLGVAQQSAIIRRSHHRM